MPNPHGSPSTNQQPNGIGLNNNSVNNIPTGNSQNPSMNPSRPQGQGLPQYSIGDLYAMNPQFVQQYLAVRGISLNPNIISQSSQSNNIPRPVNGGPTSLQPQPQMLQQSFMFQNQANLLAQQMNNNPSLMQMNTPLINNPVSNPQILPQQQQYFYQQQPIRTINTAGPVMASAGSIMLGNNGKINHNTIPSQPRPMMTNQNGFINPNFSSVNNMGQLLYRPNQLLRPPVQHQIPLNTKNTNNRNQVQQPSFRPPLDPEAAAAAKISAETREHARVIRSRIMESLSNDHKSLASPNIKAPFVDKMDAINRLLPYHTVQIPEYPKGKNVIKEKKDQIINEANQVMDEISTILKQNSYKFDLRCYEKEIENLLSEPQDELAESSLNEFR